MARYIDCEAACAEVDKGDLLVGNNAEFAKEIIYRTPTADVVPKSEVAREIFEEIEKIRVKEIHRCEVMREREKNPTERKYWEGGEHSLRQLSYWLAELKKKYTEGEPNGSKD